MDLKVIVICRNELRLSNDDCSEKTHFLNIQSNRFRITNTEQPINLIDLNMNVQDKFHS